MQTHTFNGIEYSFKNVDGRTAVYQGDKFLGTYAAMHGAFHAASLDAFPSEPRRTLRVRP